MQISNVSNPVFKNSINMVTGYGWLEKEIKLYLILNNDLKIQLEIVEKDEYNIYFKTPDIAFNCEKIVVECDEDNAEYYINKPIIDWSMGNEFEIGEEIRFFGKSLCNLNLYENDEILSNKKQEGIEVYIENENVKTKALDVFSSFYEISFDCPKLDNGSYKIYAISNGVVSNKLDIRIINRTHNNNEYNIFDFGAIGNGIKDDSVAINSAIKTAYEDGGGIVLIPAGNYLIKNTIHILPNITLTGEGKNRTWLYTPTGVGLYGDRFEGEQVEVVLTGEKDFVVKDMSVFSVYSKTILLAPTKFSFDSKHFGKSMTHDYCESDDAKNIKISNCRFEICRTYRHHYRFGEPFFYGVSPDKHCSWGDEYIIALRGDNFTVENSTIRSSGGGILLKGVNNVKISNNELFCGSSGNAIFVVPNFIFREMDENNKIIRQPKLTENIVIENNETKQASNISAGSICFMTHSRNAYIAKNKLTGTWERDSECIVWHSWGFRLPFNVVSVGKNYLEFSKDEAKKYIDKIPEKCIYFDNEGIAYNDALCDFDVIIINGKGIGQKFTIKANEGNKIFINENIEISPDETSMFVLSEFAHYENNFVSGNQLNYTGPGIYMWGSGYNNIFEGNTLERTAGIILHDLGGHVNELKGWVWTGNYYHRILNNTISCGRFDGECESFNAFYLKRQTIVGNCSSSPYGVATFGMFIDKNKFSEDAFISVVGTGGGKTYGVVVADNLFKNSNIAMIVEGDTRGVVANNKYDNVLLPIKSMQNNLCLIDEVGNGFDNLTKGKNVDDKIYCKLLPAIGIYMNKDYQNGEVVININNTNSLDVPCLLKISLNNQHCTKEVVLRANEKTTVSNAFLIDTLSICKKDVEIFSEYKIGDYIFENRAFLSKQLDTIKKWDIEFLNKIDDERTGNGIKINSDFVNFLDYDNGLESYWVSSCSTITSPSYTKATLTINFRGPFQSQTADQWWTDREIKMFLNGKEQKIFGNAFRGPYPTYHMEQDVDINLEKGENKIEILLFKCAEVKKCDLKAFLISNEFIIQNG